MTTREQIIAAAKQVDPHINEDTVDFLDEDGMKKLEAFYAIAFEAGRVEERKECADLVEDSDSDGPDPREIADAIRARGESK